MKNKSKIAVIGGTGKSGRYLVQELLSRGYHFKILVRNPRKLAFESPLVEVVQGDVNNYETVKYLVKGSDVVISTLGWGNPPSANTIFSLATQNILRAIDELGVRRYIVVSGLHVDTPDDHKSAKTKMATEWMYENYAEATINKQIEYELLCESDADWTLVRLPIIELTDERRNIETSLLDCLGDTISASNLVYFLIDQIEDNAFVQKAPFLANV